MTSKFEKNGDVKFVPQVHLSEITSCLYPRQNHQAAARTEAQTLAGALNLGVLDLQVIK